MKNEVIGFNTKELFNQLYNTDTKNYYHLIEHKIENEKKNKLKIITNFNQVKKNKDDQNALFDIDKLPPNAWVALYQGRIFGYLVNNVSSDQENISSLHNCLQNTYLAYGIKREDVCVCQVGEIENLKQQQQNNKNNKPTVETEVKAIPSGKEEVEDEALSSPSFSRK